MLENKGARLRFMALRAVLILPRHRQAARRLENIAAVRVMTVHTIHMALNNGMMLRQIKFPLHVEMTLKARGRTLSGINDQVCMATRTNMLAAGAVARFATNLAAHRRILNVQA